MKLNLNKCLKSPRSYLRVSSSSERKKWYVRYIIIVGNLGSADVSEEKTSKAMPRSKTARKDLSKEKRPPKRRTGVNEERSSKYKRYRERKPRKKT